jgi:hypothetical protein
LCSFPSFLTPPNIFFTIKRINEMRKTLVSLLLTLLTLPAFAHVWEVRVNQAQDGTLTWYLQSYHGVSECGIGNSGLVINGVQYAIQQTFAGDAATQSPTVFGVNSSYNNPAYRTSYALSYATIHTPFLGTTLSVYPYSNNVCWDNLVSGSGNFTPPPPPICTSCPITSWTNTIGTASNNGTACNPTDDILAANIAVSHLSCGSITGDGQFRVVFDPSGANVSYGPFTYASGIVTNVSVSLPYGTSNSTQLQVIDDDYPCSVIHGLSVPGGQFNGVVDNVPPTVSCPGNITLNVNPGQCGAMANFSATATDNCGTATVAYSQNPGTLFPVGVTTVTATATDAANNVSTPCSFTVTVVDNQLPVVNCPPNVTVNCDASTAALATGSAAATDPCGIASLNYADVSTQNANVNSAGHYNYTIARTWSATDAHNNAASCVQTITVTDVTAPTAATQNITVNLSAAGTATVNAADINNGSSDNCSPVFVGLQGTTTVTGTVCATANENGTVVLTAPNGGTITGITFASYGTPNGACGNFTIGNCHASNSIAIVSNLAIGHNSVNIPATNAVFGDPCNGTVKRLYVQATYQTQATATVPSITFDCSKVGANTVTLVVKDVTGNAATKNATVTVVDNTAPIVATQNATVQLDAAGNATVTPAAVNNGSSDACGIQSMTVSPNNFTCANVGANPVVLTVTDVNGNVSSNTAVVTVEDKVAPVLSVPVNAAVSCDASTATAATGVATATDACGGVNVTYADASTQDANVNNAGHYNYAITRTWTATDANNNVSSATQEITVSDATASSVTAPANQTVSCDGSTATANTGVATGSDNCSPVTITYADASTQSANVNDAAHYNYTIARTWTATDVSGNASNAVQTITVQDIAAPSITCPATASASCNITPAKTGTATGTDNCSPVAVSYTDASTQSGNSSNASYYDYTITRTWKTMDVSGNFNTCNQTIAVSEMRAAAIAVTPVNTINSNHNNYTIYLGYGPQSLTMAASVQGGIGTKTYSWAPTTGVANASSATTSVSPTVTTTYTVTITDATGCTVQKSFTIYVIDVRCGNKIQICHYPPGNHGNPQQQCLPASAIPAHLAHGCVLGACPQNKNSNSSTEEESHDLNDMTAGAVRVYPNPNSGIFTIEVPTGMQNAEVTIMDMAGKTVVKKAIEFGNTIKIDLGDASRGIYMINVVSGDKHFRSKVSVQ